MAFLLLCAVLHSFSHWAALAGSEADASDGSCLIQRPKLVHRDESYPDAAVMGPSSVNRGGSTLPLSLSGPPLDVSQMSFDQNFTNGGYGNLLLPDPQKGLSPFSRSELYYSDIITRNIWSRLGAWGLALESATYDNTAQWLHGTMALMVNVSLALGPSFLPNPRNPHGEVRPNLNRPWLQAYGKSYTQPDYPVYEDDFSAQLLAYGIHGLFFQKQADGSFLLDFSTDGTPRTRMQEIVRGFVRTAPEGMLRCKAYLSSEPKLLKIEVFTGSGGGILAFTPGSTRWELAKKVVHVMFGYVADCLHGGVHLYSAMITASVQNALPLGNKFGDIIDPHTLRTLQTVLEAASLLHGDHGAVWTGQIWQTNVSELRSVIADNARVFLEESLDAILGCEEGKRGDMHCPTEWWGGGAPKFSAPISAFADTIVEEIIPHGSRAPQYLKDVEKELGGCGLHVKGSRPLGLTTRKGLKTFLHKLFWLQSVFHSGYWHTREEISPLGYILSLSRPMLPLLETDATDAMTADEAVNSAYPAVTPEMLDTAKTLFVVTCGVEKTPVLGEGPYYYSSKGFEQGQAAFLQGLDQARAKVKAAVPESNLFVPYAFYPQEDDKPSGLFLSVTTVS